MRLNVLLWLVLLAIGVQGQDERVRNFPKQTVKAEHLPKPEKVWIFVMAGQSNMAGRGLVEPQDTVPNTRILTLNKNNEIILAKEPLHFYEPNLTGLDCGVAFARRLLKDIDKSITILMVPAAVGGSSSYQWLGDSLHRNVKLMTNFRDRVEAVKKYGTIKGILWHQGESDTDSVSLPGYHKRLKEIFLMFRDHVKNVGLPIIVGELGSYATNQFYWDGINVAIRRYSETDHHVRVIDTKDLISKNDKIHFNSASQREMGKRMAEEFLKFNNH